MTALRLLAPVIAGLMLLLTYFLVQGATPDPALHERTLDAFRQLILSDADLRRGVLAARTGRLRNYDPLVRAVEDMRDAAIRLQTADHVAGAAAQLDIRHRIEQSAAAGSVPRARKAPSMPVSTSPVPPLAMPGLPVGFT